jgi:ABC-type multidrug transport system fused ATPase/permease subunit
LLAAALFAEPMLFGRIIDTLANSQSRAAELDWDRLIVLLGAWVGFALFTIVSGTLISLHADRLSHRQYQVVRTMFFEHVLQLPASYHSGAHSGRLVKVMVTGTNTLWSLWLAFFPRALRQHRLAPRAAAGHPVRQLALRPAADRALLRVRGADLLHHFAERKAAGQGRALLQRRVERTTDTARQHRAGAELHPHRERRFTA